MEPHDRIKAELMDARDLDRTLSRMARQVIEIINPEQSLPSAWVPLCFDAARPNESIREEIRRLSRLIFLCVTIWRAADN